jgi:hypothetical protein
MYQFLWTELIEPVFTLEEREEYHEMACSYGHWSQIYPIGNQVNGRQMFHGMGSIDLCNAAIEFINAHGHDGKLITVKDKNGIDYGYKRVLVTPGDEENDPVYEIVRDEEITELLTINQDDPSIYLQSRIETIDGEDVTITPTLNSYAGWEEII